jgi:hypothetical protein
MQRFVRRHHKLLAIAMLVALACVILAPAAALARAGGGHISNPGRSSSGGGIGNSSSGGGGSFLGGVALGSATSGGSFGGCCTGIVIVVIIIVAYVIITNMLKSKGGGGSGPDFTSLTGEGGTPMNPSGPVSFAQVQADDPNFSEQAFYGRVNEMFLEIQKAWEARNMEPARRFLAQEQFQVLADGVGEYVRNGQINKLDSIHIDRVVPVSVTREGTMDYVKVLITASVIDYTIDERTGQLVNPNVLGDGKTVKQFDEYWTLERKVGAQTKANATIKKCPNCGGPVTDGNYVKCAYCGMMMNDPSLDWVLLRIEQP